TITLHSVSQVVYDKILNCRPKLKPRRFILHHDKAPAHTERKTEYFIYESSIDILILLIPCLPIFPRYGGLGFLATSKNQRNTLRRGYFIKGRADLKRWIHHLQQCKDINGDYEEQERVATKFASKALVIVFQNSEPFL